jgi:hypothetical protein
VTNDDRAPGESLEEGTREANSNLQRLIEAIGGLLAASGDVLARLQHILGGVQPTAGGSSAPEEPGPPPDGRDE